MSDATVFNIPSGSLTSGAAVSFLWGYHRGFILLNNTKKNASTENIKCKGIMTLFVEATKGPGYIKEQQLCICLEVQGVSEVCLSTNRILGQHPVRRDGSQTAILRQLETDEKKKKTNRCQHRK